AKISSPSNEIDAAFRFSIHPKRVAGRFSITLTRYSAWPAKLPLDVLKTLHSQKSQTIGRAWRANTCCTFSPPGSQKVSVADRLAWRLMQSARYVATASA